MKPRSKAVRFAFGLLCATLFGPKSYSAPIEYRVLAIHGEAPRSSPFSNAVFELVYRVDTSTLTPLVNQPNHTQWPTSSTSVEMQITGGTRYDGVYAATNSLSSSSWRFEVAKFGSMIWFPVADFDLGDVNLRAVNDGFGFPKSLYADFYQSLSPYDTIAPMPPRAFAQVVPNVTKTLFIADPYSAWHAKVLTIDAIAIPEPAMAAQVITIGFIVALSVARDRGRFRK